MSFSKPRLKNPASKFIDFKGDTGEFRYWDKEQEKNITLNLPLYMIVLDELTTIKGFSEHYGSGIYSNEIHNLKTETLHVRSYKGGLDIVGRYNDISDQVKANGGKFCKSVYAMLITGKGQYELVNFQLSGSAFSSWIDKRFDVEQFGVIVKPEMEDGKKGSISYKVPKFGKLNVTQEYYDAARNMDQELQKYLEEYKNRQASGSREQEVNETVEDTAQGNNNANHYDNAPMPDNEPSGISDDEGEDESDLPF